MQPYLFPYIGYFQLINAVDTFVIYDDVNYINRGWINRNNILINNEKKLFTISLKEASQNKLINEIEICDDFQKFLKTLRLNYSKAPFLDDVYPLIEKITSFENKRLSDFTLNSLIEIILYLNIKKEFILSSNLLKKNFLKGQDKIINICETLNATTYVNAIGGNELYNKDIFLKHNIKLLFIKTELISYKQFNNEFVPWLSIIDLLMFNSKEKIKSMLNQYELIQ